MKLTLTLRGTVRPRECGAVRRERLRRQSEGSDETDTGEGVGLWEKAVAIGRKRGYETDTGAGVAAMNGRGSDG